MKSQGNKDLHLTMNWENFFSGYKIQNVFQYGYNVYFMCILQLLCSKEEIASGLPWNILLTIIILENIAVSNICFWHGIQFITISTQIYLPKDTTFWPKEKWSWTFVPQITRFCVHQTRSKNETDSTLRKSHENKKFEMCLIA